MDGGDKVNANNSQSADIDKHFVRCDLRSSVRLAEISSILLEKIKEMGL